MMTNRHTHAALLRLYQGAMQAQPVEPGDLASACDCSLPETTALLQALDRAGLVDADRLRLTMAGLCVAVSLCAAGVPASSAAPECAA